MIHRPRPKLVVFASGSCNGGGSGFEQLVRATRHGGTLDAEIAAVVSNHSEGGVWKRAKALSVPFLHFPKPWDAEAYQRIASDTRADFFALSGWLKLVAGLDPKTNFNAQTVFNIHPGPLPAFGGPGMYGHHVHEAVMEAYRRGDVARSAVSMHFVTEEYDRGPVFFQCLVPISDDDTPDTLGTLVNQQEHIWQPIITNLVVHREITWDGRDPDSLALPRGYALERWAQ